MTKLHTIQIDRSAQKAIGKLDPQTKDRVRKAIDKLGANPRPAGTLMLAGQHGSYRIRVGNYRIVYTIQDDVLVVTVVEVGHRSEIYG